MSGTSTPSTLGLGSTASTRGGGRVGVGVGGGGIGDGIRIVGSTPGVRLIGCIFWFFDGGYGFEDVLRKFFGGAYPGIVEGF